ncbi:MAG: hypothetical protein F6K25_28640 [Okeania sp. SIO2G4]|uniref:hypothetical protein n=1 Tax=unclassified Okeania TaxID=2634635 RepID=UPI0013BAD1EC|nr:MULTISPECIES: hypothetical protein [unclassified Okeania]NEP39025.1 hypothetical protein [Okeania sp. SIO2H7]NEP75561.1 hypothetical protein [Okeania sp. SIO2G5]NEP96697.1 hypothetical protein [Okeania sp. SIO2F5]NEQ94407.1 hypothetical protein [Okeania sp. SIO2G4]
MSIIKILMIKSMCFLTTVATISNDSRYEAKKNNILVSKNNYFQLAQANSVENLQDIVGEDAQVKKVVEGFKFIERPVWHPEGFLLFSDIPENTIYQ